MPEGACSFLERVVQNVASPMRKHVLQKRRFTNFNLTVFFACCATVFVLVMSAPAQLHTLDVVLLWVLALLVMYGILYVVWEFRFRLKMEPRYNNVVAPRLISTVCRLQAKNRLPLLLDIHLCWYSYVQEDVFDRLKLEVVEDIKQMDGKNYFNLTSLQRNELFKVFQTHTRFLIQTQADSGPPEGIPLSDHDGVVSIGILQFYERVGDVSKIKYITSLTKHYFEEECKVALQVQRQAEMTLSILKSLNIEDRSLLRPADEPANVEHLLTPIFTEQETELLRPSGLPKQNEKFIHTPNEGSPHELEQLRSEVGDLQKPPKS